MNKWQKIVFWIATTIIAIDNLYWQWAIKLTIEPNHQPVGGILGSMIFDIGLLVVWLWLLLKIYRQANGKYQLNPAQSEQKQKHLAEVLELAKQKGEIRNDDIQHALGVSDATATRYLDDLEAAGKLTQIGEKKATLYRPK